VFSVYSGLDWIATVPPTTRLHAIFGKEKASVGFGWIIAAHQPGAATAPNLPGFFVAGAACLIASGLAWLNGAPRPAPATAAA
jgi:hypothetical protein